MRTRLRRGWLALLLLLLVALLAPGCNINPIPTPGGDATTGGGGSAGGDAGVPPLMDVGGTSDAGSGPSEDVGEPGQDVVATEDVAAGDVAGDVEGDAADAEVPDGSDVVTDGAVDDSEDTAPDCECPNDGNPCTEELCEGGECVIVPVEEPASCDDGDFCTTGDYCEDGECVPGAPRDCWSACEGPGCAPVAATCDEEHMKCLCDCDEPFCDIEEREGCETDADCDDGDPCTEDSCLTFLDPSVCVCEPVENCTE